MCKLAHNSTNLWEFDPPLTAIFGGVKLAGGGFAADGLARACKPLSRTLNVEPPVEIRVVTFSQFGLECRDPGIALGKLSKHNFGDAVDKLVNG